MFKAWKTAKCGLIAAVLAVTGLSASTALAQEACGDDAQVLRLAEVAKAGVTLEWRTVEQLGGQLAQHPALTDYVIQSQAFVQSVAGNPASQQTIDALIDYMEINEAVPSEFAQVVGAPPELFDQLGELIGQVGDDPTIALMAAPDKSAVVNQAVVVAPVNQGDFETIGSFDPAAEEDEAGTTLETCKDDCRDAFLDAVEAAEERFAERLEVCADKAGWRRGFCRALAGGRLTSEIARARHVMEDCIENCNETHGEPGEGGAVNTCSRDSDCAADEYCTVGFMGLGSHECRQKKVNGDRCSRSRQCLSNRCRWGKCKP